MTYTRVTSTQELVTKWKFANDKTRTIRLPTEATPTKAAVEAMAAKVVEAELLVDNYRDSLVIGLDGNASIYSSSTFEIGN